MVIQSLFFLEYMLFKAYTVKNESFLANIKLKWLIDQVSKTDEMDKTLYNLKPLTDNFCTLHSSFSILKHLIALIY